MDSSRSIFGPVLVCFAFSGLVCLGQFYAPDTVRHDPVQRVFVVEAARVLAWRANQVTNQIAEITHHLTTDTNLTTRWQIDWRDAKGKTIKSCKVEYPETCLKEGEEFYRQAMRQLWSAGWAEPKRLKEEDAVKAFWRGAGQAAPNREESLTRAFALVSDKSSAGNEALPLQMSGLLVHAALPGVAGGVSIDSILLARGAAWLTLAEHAGANSLGRVWSPVLFLAGRERAAVELWKKNAPTNEPPANAMIAGWDLWLRNPTSKQAYLWSVDNTNWTMSIALLARDVQVNGRGALLAEVIEPLTRSPRVLGSLHNYAPLFASRTGVGGGHITDGAWVVLQRHAWLDLLARCPPEGLDLREKLRMATNALARGAVRDIGVDASLHGFKETAPLLRLGRTEGTGKLVPTATATVRDVLNYGWETAGLQMGTRYQFVNRKWGVPEQAKPIFQTVTSEVEGLYPFFLRSEHAGISTYQESLRRLQNVDGFHWRVGWSPNPFATNANTLGSAKVFAERCWLRPTELEWQIRSLWDEAWGEITNVVEAMRLEGGARGAAAALDYFTAIQSGLREPWPQADAWMAAFAEKLPQPSRLSVGAQWSAKFKGRPAIDIARDLEKLYWTNPEGGLEERVSGYYANAGDFKAVRRFYMQARENFLDPIGVAQGLGTMAFVAGYLQNDPTWRELAVEDSYSGSYSDMVLHIWDAALRKDDAALKMQVQELIERYESRTGPESKGRLLLNFLPLLPALADPKDQRHDTALRHFEKNNNWVFLRWMWIEALKLSPADAIIFLGGRENDVFRLVLICYLDGDLVQTEDAVKKLTGTHAPLEQIYLTRFLAAKLSKTPPPADSPDLKPPGAVSTRTAVLSRLKGNRPRN